MHKSPDGKATATDYQSNMPSNTASNSTEVSCLLDAIGDAREDSQADLERAEMQLQEAMVVLADREIKVQWAREKLKSKINAFTKAITDYPANHTELDGVLIEAISDDEQQNSESTKELELQRWRKEWAYGIWLAEYLRAANKHCMAMERVVYAERKKHASVKKCWELECAATELNESPSAKPIEFEM
ncbi:hypothetical protein L211DRAFT_266907 [Terfezia boudieri ATCC MYA-4762]|uniref:Uncharacterized protein n=1 Tax=Terfezia boudieri ATCC MYA-4762 TaxID=1051890 RepID=A0A3N4LKS3_9PEZI|nr:hypothetical protein L211DRAFT_266907 [Terfezia boudieri ATCC MYA-4762]